MFLSKKPQNPEWVTEKKERMDYYLYFCGQNMIYTLVTTFLATFLLFRGIDPTKTAAVMLVVKVWDAVNDAIFGCIFDKVHFKSKQKFLPWLKISLPAIPIATILLFFIPKTGVASETIQLAWFAVAYILWDTAYTLCDVPIFGLVTAMTNRLDERTSLLSYKSIWSGVGTGLAFIIATVLTSQYVGLSYGVCAIAVGVVAFFTMLPICRNGKERYQGEEDESFTLKKMFSYLFSNKYLLIYYGGYFLYNSLNVMMTVNLFASYYLFNNEIFSLLVMALSAIPMLIASLFVPKLVKKFDKMKIYLVCCVSIVVLGTITWLIGYSSIVAFIILTVLRFIPIGVMGVMMFMFTPDCAEYGKFKTGIDAKGITFAIQTFMVKLTTAIASSLALLMLGFFGWQTVNADNFQQLKELGITQSQHTLDGLWFTYQMLPIIGYAIATVAWYFYKLKDSDVQIMTDANCGKITREEAVEKLSPGLKKEIIKNDKKSDKEKMGVK